MERPHAQDPGQASTPNEYKQLSFEGVETENAAEVLLENCVVASRPHYRKNGTSAQWQCRLHAPPDIFHQDRDEMVVVQTTRYAQRANKLQLRPGDRVDLKGLLSQQELELGSGEKQRVNHLVVSDIHVLSRAKRVSLTVYERKRGR